MWHARGMRYALGVALVVAIAMSGKPTDAQMTPDPNGAPNPYRMEEHWAKRMVMAGRPMTAL